MMMHLELIKTGCNIVIELMFSGNINLTILLLVSVGQLIGNITTILPRFCNDSATNSGCSIIRVINIFNPLFINDGCLIRKSRMGEQAYLMTKCFSFCGWFCRIPIREGRSGCRI